MSTHPRKLALLATIPPRRTSCERLLQELPKQSRRLDGVILCLDGYGYVEAPPRCPWALPVADVFRTLTPSGGPGHRWGAPLEMLATGPLPPLDLDCLAPDDVVLCLDDDLELGEAPDFVRSLLEAV